MTMNIAYLKDWKGKKRGDFETMPRSDFLKLYNQDIATSEIDWNRTHAAKFAGEQANAKRKAEKEAADKKAAAEKKKEDAKPKRGRPKKEKATSKKSEAREKAID